MRKSHNISPRTKVFINIGRCTDQKNQKFILRLASERKDKDELYVIIGEGPLYDNLASEKEALGLDKLLLAENVMMWPTGYVRQMCFCFHLSTRVSG